MLGHTIQALKRNRITLKRMNLLHQFVDTIRMIQGSLDNIPNRQVKMAHSIPVGKMLSYGSQIRVCPETVVHVFYDCRQSFYQSVTKLFLLYQQNRFLQGFYFKIHANYKEVQKSTFWPIFKPIWGQPLPTQFLLICVI